MNYGTRFLLVGALASVAGIAAAQQQDLSKVEIKVTKVAGNVYLLEGAGGNIAASVGDDGIVIVDDQFAPLADKIRAALKGLTAKPLRFIINTHYHFDHTGGNLPLHDATIVAHRAQRAGGVDRRGARGVRASERQLGPGSVRHVGAGRDHGNADRLDRRSDRGHPRRQPPADVA